MSALRERKRATALDELATAWQQRQAVPDSVLSVQRRALDSVLERGLPGPRDEQWKYTDLRRFGSRHFAAAAPGPQLAAQDLEARLIAASGWHRLVLVDGRFHAELSTPLPTARHVAVGTLATSIAERPDRVATWLASHAAPAAPLFAAINAAFSDDGIVIELEAEGEIAEPVYVVHVGTARDRATMRHARVIVDAGPGSRMMLIEHHVTLGRADAFDTVVTDLRLAADARIEHYRIQEQHARSYHFARVEAHAAERAHLSDYRVALGKGFDRTDIDVQLEGPGAHATLNGLFMVDESAHVDTHTRIDHAAPETTSAEDYRGIACERGRGVFNGKVVVRPGSQKIVARQSSHNLLLSADAEIDTKPELEIYADDVKCSHGATTGQLDPGALFYLRSRGIGEHDARALLTRAFAASVVESMSLGPVREHLERKLYQRFLLRDGGEA
jgi:Fe-S cluster assembly protein SufD